MGGRAPCGSCERQPPGGGGRIRKGAWTAHEDEKLLSFIRENKGHGSWRTLPHLAGLERCGKSCRLRWTNYLRPNVKRGNFSPEEERIIVGLHACLGNKWSSIASHLPGRTDNEVKNQWNTHLKKRLLKAGIDPTTHLPLLQCNNVAAADQRSCSITNPSSSSACSHLAAHWELLLGAQLIRAATALDNHANHVGSLLNQLMMFTPTATATCSMHTSDQQLCAQQGTQLESLSRSAIQNHQLCVDSGPHIHTLLDQVYHDGNCLEMDGDHFSQLGQITGSQFTAFNDPELLHHSFHQAGHLNTPLPPSEADVLCNNQVHIATVNTSCQEMPALSHDPTSYWHKILDSLDVN